MEIYISSSIDETETFARDFSKRLSPGDVVAFTGGMGVGKTAFMRGVAAGLNTLEHVSSPTFALVNEYHGKYSIIHFDMYRISTANDLYSTGFFDYLDGESILFIEWSENIRDFLPENTVVIDISFGESENERIIKIYEKGELKC